MLGRFQNLAFSHSEVRGIYLCTLLLSLLGMVHRVLVRYSRSRWFLVRRGDQTSQRSGLDTNKNGSKVPNSSMASWKIPNASVGNTSIEWWIFQDSNEWFSGNSSYQVLPSEIFLWFCKWPPFGWSVQVTWKKWRYVTLLNIHHDIRYSLCCAHVFIWMCGFIQFIHGITHIIMILHYCCKLALQQLPFRDHSRIKLVGGFNPSENTIYSQIGSSPQVGVKIKSLWNQHLEKLWS